MQPPLPWRFTNRRISRTPVVVAPKIADTTDESRESFLERIIREHAGGDNGEGDGKGGDVDDNLTGDNYRKRKDRDTSDESARKYRSLVSEHAPPLKVVSELDFSSAQTLSSSSSLVDSTDMLRVGVMSPPTARAPTPIVANFSRKRQPNMLSGTSFMLQLLQADAEEEAERLRRTRVHLRWEYEVHNVKFKGNCLGDVRMKRKDEALAFIYENVMQPSKHQRLMHLALKAISYPSFYGAELNMHMVRLLRENNWSEFRTEAIVEAPRRFGKTVGTSMDAAAELVTQPGNATSEYGHDVLCYSNNHRASKMLLLQTYKFVKSLCGEGKFGGRIIGLNKNESIRFMTREGYINEMYAYPAKPETLRGTGSKCPTGTVIAEEFAYIPEEVFFGILAPTLTRRNVKFIGITTVNGSDSFVSPLTSAKFPDGRSVFLTLNFQLICTECKAAKREAQCRCLIGDIPHWQSSSQHDKLTIIMERRIGKFLQEIKGLAIDETTTPAFCQVACEFLRTPEAVMKVAEIHSDAVFMAVDPACGGRYSKFAIVSAIFVRDPKSSKVLMIVSCYVCRC